MWNLLSTDISIFRHKLDLGTSDRTVKAGVVGDVVGAGWGSYSVLRTGVHFEITICITKVLCIETSTLLNEYFEINFTGFIFIKFT